MARTPSGTQAGRLRSRRMTDDSIGWGVIATGGIAADFVRDLHGAGLRVAAAGSRTQERADAFAAEHGIPHAHGSWDALVADPDVDAVYVATPHPAHVDAALAALSAGKHVLVEKPFTLNAAETRRIQVLAAERGLIALEAMWTRWLPHMLEIHALIADGAIGEPRLLVAEHLQSLPQDPAHRLNDPALGGGALLDLGVYPVSFAHDLFGPPHRVEAVADIGPTGVDRRTSALLIHADGAQSLLTCASDLPGPSRAAITGSAGSIEIEPVWFAETGFTVLDERRRVVHRSRPPVDGSGKQVSAIELERLVRKGRTASERMPPEGTLAVMKTLDRIRERIGVRYPQESAG